MNDNLIMEAVKSAIVNIFFNPVTITDPNGYTQTIGGYSYHLVDSILKEISLDEIARKITPQVNTDEIAQQCSHNLYNVLFEKDWDKYKPRREVMEHLANAIQSVLENSDVFKKAVENRIGDLMNGIEIQINVIPKREEK